MHLETVLQTEALGPGCYHFNLEHQVSLPPRPWPPLGRCWLPWGRVPGFLCVPVLRAVSYVAGKHSVMMIYHLSLFLKWTEFEHSSVTNNAETCRLSALHIVLPSRCEDERESVSAVCPGEGRVRELACSTNHKGHVICILLYYLCMCSKQYMYMLFFPFQWHIHTYVYIHFKFKASL